MTSSAFRISSLTATTGYSGLSERLPVCGSIQVAVFMFLRTKLRLHLQSLLHYLFLEVCGVVHSADIKAVILVYPEIKYRNRYKSVAKSLLF